MHCAVYELTGPWFNSHRAAAIMLNIDLALQA